MSAASALEGLGDQCGAVPVPALGMRVDLVRRSIAWRSDLGAPCGAAPDRRLGNKDVGAQFCRLCAGEPGRPGAVPPLIAALGDEDTRA